MRETWARRVRASEVAVSEARARRQSFLELHGHELVAAAAEPEAVTAQDKVIRAAEALVEAFPAYGGGVPCLRGGGRPPGPARR